MSIKRTHDSRGRFAKTVWHISDEPYNQASAAPYCDNPNMDKPDTEQPHLGKQAHINTNKTIKPRNKKTTTSLDDVPVADGPPLRLTALVSAETRSQIFKALEQVAPVDQQRMLNELSAAIKAGSIKTTAVRWFHGIIKRYRDGSYNFKDRAPAEKSTCDDNAPHFTSTDKPEIGPSTVKNENRSTVGKEYLNKLRTNRSSSGPSPVRILTTEKPGSSSEI